MTDIAIRVDTVAMERDGELFRSASSVDLTDFHRRSIVLPDGLVFHRLGSPDVAPGFHGLGPLTPVVWAPPSEHRDVTILGGGFVVAVAPATALRFPRSTVVYGKGGACFSTENVTFGSETGPADFPIDT